VRITTEERDGCYVAAVSDNGPGFDYQTVMENHTGHVGLVNVKERVERMCGGRLQVAETSPEGSTVEIIIPKKEYTE